MNPSQRSSREEVQAAVNERYCLWLLKKSLRVEKLPKLGDQKCIPRWRKSFIEHPSASGFQGESVERVFQRPRLLSTTIK
jgi:hypothetical protein